MFTELKSDHSKLSYFCQAFRSQLIEISFSLEQIFYYVTCACACEPLIPNVSTHTNDHLLRTQTHCETTIIHRIAYTRPLIKSPDRIPLIPS
ncbi:unnamed protein product [Macrosiphum euphorbiae]|uniref:Uncharacterized protein n=1 Tax=Macrosiphum euphorbiae TaxID=13131 RepID=A0AAV0WAT2_9HEMI|nr:unnamed protein product [Macrosiphum euphorbiae]